MLRGCLNYNIVQFRWENIRICIQSLAKVFVNFSTCFHVTTTDFSIFLLRFEVMDTHKVTLVK